MWPKWEMLISDWENPIGNLVGEEKEKYPKFSL